MSTDKVFWLAVVYLENVKVCQEKSENKTKAELRGLHRKGPISQNRNAPPQPKKQSVPTLPTTTLRPHLSDPVPYLLI